ncbi:MAG: hypothetical protein MJE66_10935, partial [Proteobacteria bacterium]|nr:hypothetical protein [Pseudomonadota bacterium]
MSSSTLAVVQPPRSWIHLSGVPRAMWSEAQVCRRPWGEKRRFREFGPGRARHAPAQRHSRLQAHQLARRRGIRDPQIAAPQ